jgi:26S proteasome regulatory subunit N9
MVYATYSRRFWHQLTLKLFEFFEHPLSRPYRVDVFERFVRDFETKINQLRLAEMGVKVSKVIDSKCHVVVPVSGFDGAPFTLDPAVHLAFLVSLLSRIDVETSKEAHVLLLATIAHAKLLYGDLDGTKTDMDAAWKILDHLSGVDNGVNAAYYGVAADYYKVNNAWWLIVKEKMLIGILQAKAEYTPYYRNSLLYLACVDVATDMSEEERLVRAHDLGISAFLGDSIYNFGELVSSSFLSNMEICSHETFLVDASNPGRSGQYAT